MYVRPAEWRKGKTIWLAWPFDHKLWGDDLAGAEQEFIALVDALVNEHLVIIFPNKFELERGTALLGVGPHLAFKILSYGDIWLRDTLPIFVKDERGRTAAVLPKFNGWGKKYWFQDDRDLSARVADVLLVPKVETSVVFEGGAIECDGAGTLLTTEQCLLNINRNPQKTKREIEKELANYFGAKKVIWLKEGLKNDHTDGHIDTIARFIGPQQIAIMVPTTQDDPNFAALMAIKQTLLNETDAHGNPFTLIEIPSPGAVYNRDGDIMPASYLNFIIGDENLIVPLFGTPHDNDAVRILSNHTSLSTTGLNAKSILTGGGGFHCISQEYFR